VINSSGEKTDEIKYENASRILKQKREMLFAEYLKENTPSFLERHSRLLDDYFFESFEKSIIGPGMAIAKNPFAIIALGGYGRQEQCIHSDVDLLFLFGERVPGNAANLIKEVVYPLWDIGLDIGHATRSMKECISIAGNDYQVLTSLLDARFICGMSLLYSDLVEEQHFKASPLRRFDIHA
jgi:[protein-PII] uridylyltransferase